MIVVNKLIGVSSELLGLVLIDLGFVWISLGSVRRRMKLQYTHIETQYVRNERLSIWNGGNFMLFMDYIVRIWS